MSPRVRPWRGPLVWLAVLWLIAGLSVPAWAADGKAAAEQRLAKAARYLASDELEGRGLGTEGIDLAAEYIAERFAEIGLKTGLFDGTPMQPFSVVLSTEIGTENRLMLVPPAGNGAERETIELEFGHDFMPLAVGDSGEFDLPLVFAGYGITAEAEGYDDYAGVDATGKAVIVLRHEPQQADPDSVFDGTEDSVYATYARKIANAVDHGAAAVIFCTDEFEILRGLERLRRQWQRALGRLTTEAARLEEIDSPNLRQIEAQRARIDGLIGQVQRAGERLRGGYDPVLAFRAARADEPADLPVLHCRRAVLDRALEATLGTDLAALEDQIDQGPKPHSREVTGWRVAGRTDIRREQVAAKNVIAVLEAEGPLSEETIVVGAHYDHLGFTQGGSMTDRFAEYLFGAQPRQRVIYNGADDNASGVAAMIEVARSLAGQGEKLRRRVVFIAFSAEEEGLLGSAHYVRHPLVPLADTVAMVNLDMVGRLRDETLIVGGSNTAATFDAMLEGLNRPAGLQLTRTTQHMGDSDQAPFLAERIPVLFFFTGLHAQYHRPSDDFETLNVAGMRRVSEFVEEVVEALANDPQRPQYVAAPRPPRRPSGPRPYFGTVADLGAEGSGFAIGSVEPRGPAERAGLAAGDVIVRFGDREIGGPADLDAALAQHQAGERVRVEVRRGEESLVVEVTLGPPR